MGSTATRHRARPCGHHRARRLSMSDVHFVNGVCCFWTSQNAWFPFGFLEHQPKRGYPRPQRTRRTFTHTSTIVFPAPAPISTQFKDPVVTGFHAFGAASSISAARFWPRRALRVLRTIRTLHLFRELYIMLYGFFSALKAGENVWRWLEGPFLLNRSSGVTGREPHGLAMLPVSGLLIC